MHDPWRRAAALDPLAETHEMRRARIASSPEFAVLVREIVSALAVEDLIEDGARTSPVPADVRAYAKRLVTDVLTCAHGETASLRAIEAVRSLMQDASERKNREGTGWWSFLTRLFRRPSAPASANDGGLRIERGGYPDGFPARVKDQVGFVVGNLHLNCPELDERLRVLSPERMAALDSALEVIADKWDAPGRKMSPWTMASLVADALGLGMPDDPRIKRSR
jgi:hypothetical protein